MGVQSKARHKIPAATISMALIKFFTKTFLQNKISLQSLAKKFSAVKKCENPILRIFIPYAGFLQPH